MKMLIKKQSKRILAILLAGIMMCNMPYFKPIIAMAEDIEVGGTVTVTCERKEFILSGVSGEWMRYVVSR